jgi:hypothetical protein
LRTHDLAGSRTPDLADWRTPDIADSQTPDIADPRTPDMADPRTPDRDDGKQTSPSTRSKVSPIDSSEAQRLARMEYLLRFAERVERQQRKMQTKGSDYLKKASSFGPAPPKAKLTQIQRRAQQPPECPATPLMDFVKVCAFCILYIHILRLCMYVCMYLCM